jgi:D-amino-acid dehydrogenase
MKYDVAILGAGMIGVSCALHLQRCGKTVALIDRREPGRETSFGNAGIIQREAIEPYELPRKLSFLAHAATNRRLDVRYHLGALALMARPLYAYYRNSAKERHAAISRDYASIIALSLETHAELIKAARAEALIGTQGYLTLCRSEKELSRLYGKADARERFGVAHRKLSGADLAREEPALKATFAGAVHWTDPVTIRSPGDLVQAYARLLIERGAHVLRGDAASLNNHMQGEWQIEAADGNPIRAAEVVIALGPWSVMVTKRFGYAPPMFFKRGYHMHYAVQPAQQLGHWMIDAEQGFVLCPMKNGIRLTTGAEIALTDSPATPHQLDMAEKIARRDYPLGARVDQQPWKGTRPCMPDMKPVIGQIPSINGMWCAFGHGHQGFTLGPATGELLAAMMTGRKPQIDMTPFSPGRSFT